MDAPGDLLPTKQELNKIIRDGIYKQFVQTTWTNPRRGLHSKMAFYVKHFMEARDELIIQPSYISHQARDELIIQPSYISHHWAHYFHIPWASSEWAHIGFKLRRIIESSKKIGSTNCVIFERLSLRRASSSVRPILSGLT